VGGVDEEAEPIQLLLDLPLGLSSLEEEEARSLMESLLRSLREARQVRCWALAFLEVLLLECLHVESSLGLILAEGVLALVLALANIVLVGGVLVLLGAVGNEVVGISTAKVSLVLTPTQVIQAVVVEPRGPANDQR